MGWSPSRWTILPTGPLRKTLDVYSSVAEKLATSTYPGTDLPGKAADSPSSDSTTSAMQKMHLTPWTVVWSTAESCAFKWPAMADQLRLTEAVAADATGAVAEIVDALGRGLARDHEAGLAVAIGIAGAVTVAHAHALTARARVANPAAAANLLIELRTHDPSPGIETKTKFLLLMAVHTRRMFLYSLYNHIRNLSVLT